MLLSPTAPKQKASNAKYDNDSSNNTANNTDMSVRCQQCHAVESVHVAAVGKGPVGCAAVLCWDWNNTSEHGVIRFRNLGLGESAAVR
jgi:hypothetical protein